MSAKDPACGMDIEPEDAAGESEFQGNTYYFCSNECKRKFDEKPQSYAKQTQKPAGSKR